MEQLFWVGIKESEIRTCRHLFAGSVTYSGSGQNGNKSFVNENSRILNYNRDSIELDNFIEKTLLQIIQKNPNVKFMFYTPYYAYCLNEKIKEHTVCLNSRYVLQLLRDKLKIRLWISSFIPVLKTVAVSKTDCSLDYFENLFPGCKDFILQGCTGSGGNDTYTVHASTFQDIYEQLLPHEIYIVSPHLKSSYSVNVHILIHNGYQILPASLQIVQNEENRLIYHGADFIEYSNVPDAIKEKIRLYCQEISLRLMDIGYKGVLGIDFIVTGSQVYFLEINPRFQSSSSVINYAFAKKHICSLQEMVLNIFSKANYELPVLRNIAIPYSNYIIDAYSKNGFYSDYLKNAENALEAEEILTDGYSDACQFEDRASLFTVLFNTNIGTLNADQKLMIHENVKAYFQIPPQLKTEPDFFYLKTRLMVQGLQISPAASLYFERKGIRRGTYSSIDIYFHSSLVINCPVNLKLCSMSPFIIDSIEDQLYLLYVHKIVSKIHVDCDEAYRQFQTMCGIDYDDLSFLATDRLRIHHSMGCFYKNTNSGCLFCDVPGTMPLYKMEDIEEVIDWHIANSDFRHILIGGGSQNRSTEYKRVARIIQYLRKKTNKSLYLMSLPPEDLSILEQYHSLGLNEIAFNIEIYDRVCALKYMPGKGAIPLKSYQDALLKAVELWGKDGSVKSAMIYGLEKEESFLEGIHWMVSNGIQPIISVFRPLRNTETENRIPPDSESLYAIYSKVLDICKGNGIIPGPNCIYCQNNTLSCFNDIFCSFHS